MTIGMPHETVAQNMTQNQQQQFQLSMQQQQQLNQQQQRAQNAPGRPPNGQPPITAADNVLVQNMTNQMMANSTAEDKNQIRAGMQARMDPQTLQKYAQGGMDPVYMYFRQQAMTKFRQDRAARIAQAQTQMNVSQQQSQNIPTTAPPMQQQRSMNPSPVNGQSQPSTSIGGNPEFGLMGNVGSVIDQQQQGIMAQEAGQMVVPASAAQRNATPQPGGMPGQQMNMNDQRAVSNPNIRAQQQQQQIFNAQQAQQQRLQHAQQQQSQAAARANAQAKAQQMALQGQPGGMGSGPMPPQQSPAMATLNAPLRAPSQQMIPEQPPQINPNGQFGQPLDPRFMQPNQRPIAGVFNPAMLAAMPPQEQQRLAGLPPDKINEVVTRRHEQRAQHMNAANGQPGRPPMQMQGNNQFRPGQQVPQSGQFDHQNGLTQFMGQRPQQGLANGMTTPQQLLLEQQMRAFSQQNPNMPRPSPNGMTPIEQRTVMQMDNMEFPQSLLSHGHMPRGIPPEITKWGQLKQWAQSNPTLEPSVFENIKMLQKIHYQQLVKTKGQANGQQPMGLPNGGQTGPGTAPMSTSGMAAPVAPMGPNPMQMPNAMNVGPGQIRQPTPQEIQAARSHPSGRMANLNDDQIRQVIIRNQMTQLGGQQQMAQQRHAEMMRQMQRNQMSQANGQQQPRPGMQGQPNNGLPIAQLPHAKQPQPVPDSTIPNPGAANGARPHRSAPSVRDPGQNSSPAPTSRKRASSDDVIEVPNPNAQTQRHTTQQNQGSKSGLQQGRPPNMAHSLPTPQQIAKLDPESRKKYEQLLRMQQASQANPENMAKLKAIMDEEVTKSREPVIDVAMDQETRSRVAGLLRDMHTPLANMGKALPKWYAITRDDNRAREFFRTVRYPSLLKVN